MHELLELLSTISSKSLSQSYVLAQTGSIKKKQVNLALLLNIFCCVRDVRTDEPSNRVSVQPWAGRRSPFPIENGRLRMEYPEGAGAQEPPKVIT